MIGPFIKTKMIDLTKCELGRKYALQMETLQEETEKLFAVCNRERQPLRELFKNEAFHEWRCLREYEAIIYIDQQEELLQSKLRFWEGNMSVSQLLSKLRVLKRALKRIEYEKELDCFDIEWLKEVCSKYAITEVCERYIIDKEKVYKRVCI